MTKIILIISILLTKSVLAQNARGILEFKEEVKEVRVGETYKMNLTLLPFSKSSLTKETFLNKKFLDYFYITNVYKIYQSENNRDATVVELSAIVSKNFEIKPLYIWNLVDRNIPIEVRSVSIKDTKLSIKQFILHETGDKFSEKYLLPWLIVILIIVLTLVIVLLNREAKDNKGQLSRKALLKRLAMVRTHEDLEHLYVNKGAYLNVLSFDNNLRRSFIDILDMYRIDQFSSEWSSKSIDEIVSQVEKLSTELKRGI